MIQKSMYKQEVSAKNSDIAGSNPKTWKMRLHKIKCFETNIVRWKTHVNKGSNHHSVKTAMRVRKYFIKHTSDNELVSRI